MPPVEKRRRKKSRIQDSDSSSSSESDSSSDVDMRADELSAPSELSDAGGDDEPRRPSAEAAVAEETPRERLRKTPKADTTADFNQTFLKLVTEQFGEDLAALRQANDFGPASLSQLIAGLKQGADIFTPEQQRML